MLTFRILGPVAVLQDGEPAPLRAAKPRALLALLLVNANRNVPSERIVDELWPDDPPETATKAVQTYISQLRHLVGESRLEHQGRGYRLTVGAGELDSERFKELLSAARAEVDANAHATALEHLKQALALWQGEALEDVAAPFAATEAAHLEELRLEAVEARLDCELAVGHPAAPAELERLATEHPERERIVELAMLALYRSGRQADALALYRTVRTRLVDELGLEPSRSLRDLEQAMLRGDPSLDAPKPSPAPPGSRRLWPLYAGAVAVVVIAAAIVVALADRGGGKPEPKPPPKTNTALESFVVKMENLIAQSNDGRKQVIAIVGAAADCKLPARQGLLRLIAVEQNRQSLLDQVAALTVPAGRQPLLVTQRFQRAIQLSIASDFGYRAWLRGLAKPCSPARAAAALRAAVATGHGVAAAKAAFVAAFDPLARRFGRRAWTADDV